MSILSVVYGDLLRTAGGSFLQLTSKSSLAGSVQHAKVQWSPSAPLNTPNFITFMYMDLVLLLPLARLPMLLKHIQHPALWTFSTIIIFLLRLEAIWFALILTNPAILMLVVQMM